MKSSIRATALAALFAMGGASWAAPGDPIDSTVRYPHFETTIQVNDDGTAVETRAWAVTILKESALAYGKHAAVTYSTTAQTGEVLAAYTRKADGRRIDVPKGNYQVEVNKGRDADSPIYSDETTLQVVFPDVAVGDTVEFAYRITDKEPLFPKQYSTARTFSDELAYDDVTVRIEYPAALPVNFYANGLKQKTGKAGPGRKAVEWTYKNPQPTQRKRKDFSVFDPDAEHGYSFSTFKTWGDIAAAYGARAKPKAAVTPRVQQLADEIAKDARDPREQARLLYTWVATKITYAGNCIGIGAVVPRDLTVVLDNRIGDCKDHATLLQALLAARGIEATQALINAGAMYRLPKIPVVSSINHVINYIPSLDLYVDSTSNSTPFGLLPGGDQDKPILRVDGFKEGTRTPAPGPEANAKRLVSTAKIAADGSINGAVEMFEKGEAAAATRAWARRLTRNYENDLVKEALRSQGAIGSGTFEKDDPTELADTYHYKLSFGSEKFVRLPGAGALYVDPPLSMSRSPVQELLQFNGEIETLADVVCSSGQAEEEYSIEFPDGVQLLSVPDDVTIGNDFVRYAASYKVSGNVVTAKRRLENRMPGSVCSPQVAAAAKKIADEVMADLKSQLLYKKSRPKAG